jgi:hypothetical protein
MSCLVFLSFFLFFLPCLVLSCLVWSCLVWSGVWSGEKTSLGIDKNKKLVLGIKKRHKTNFGHQDKFACIGKLIGRHGSGSRQMVVFVNGDCVCDLFGFGQRFKILILMTVIVIGFTEG